MTSCWKQRILADFLKNISEFKIKKKEETRSTLIEMLND